MLKRTGDEDDNGIPASTPKLMRRTSNNTNSTEDNFEDDDCIMVATQAGNKCEF